jgi:hypothetical protein
MTPPYHHTGDKAKAPQIASQGPKKAYSGRYHPLCGRCQHPCKQSPKIKIIQCPQFKDKDAQ